MGPKCVENVPVSYFTVLSFVTVFCSVNSFTEINVTVFHCCVSDFAVKLFSSCFEAGGRSALYSSWLAESAVLWEPLGSVQRLAWGCYFAFHHSQPLERAHRSWQCCGWELVLLLFTSAALCSFVLAARCCSGLMRSHRNTVEKRFTPRDMFGVFVLMQREKKAHAYTHMHTLMHIHTKHNRLLCWWHFLAGW